VRVPSEDRTVLTLGMSYAINDKMSIDAAYMFLKEDTAHVNATKAYQASMARLLTVPTTKALLI
jgi:long-subunit fatty acid transport protein